MNIEIQCKVVDTAEQSLLHGVGAVRYIWNPEVPTNDFPKDVLYVCLRIPYSNVSRGIEIDFPIDPVETSTGKTWKLIGTVDCPTLTPQLNWIELFKGWLIEGLLKPEAL